MRLQNKIAYITGAGNGIGEATAEAMAREGAAVAVVDLDRDAAALVADRLCAAGARAIALAVDVSDPEAVRTSIGQVVDEFGRLDILHLNAAAGVPGDTNAVNNDLDVWERLFRVNVMGVVHGIKYGVPRMIEAGGGSVIITSSMGGQAGDLNRAAYGSLKAAVTALTRYLSVSHGRSGINANAILPGLVLSPTAAAQFPASLAAAVTKHQTTDRLTQPSDVANLAVFLASDEAIAIRGQAIAIDAGGSAQGGATPTLADAVAALVVST
ncbi:SDR family oxidoreductase [Dactylosporangium sp. NPDC005572]|uniref:SDR family NAD(P)-dependent oxidoreductase n=1 Tax=Dactylosporangium sp. NPDC005572 TaxID=3156889 RepID=UPI0033B8E83E